MWGKLVGENNIHDFLSDDLWSWLTRSLWIPDRFGVDHWVLFFSIVCWLLWKRRNLVVFVGEELATDSIVA